MRFFVSRLISRSLGARRREELRQDGRQFSPAPGSRSVRATALDMVKRRSAGVDAKCFIAMRYWKPYAAEAVREVKALGRDKRVVLLPLYPQFSTTTTASSLKSWADAGGPKGTAICLLSRCAEIHPRSHAERLLTAWQIAGKPPNVRALLSAARAAGDPRGNPAIHTSGRSSAPPRR